MPTENAKVKYVPIAEPSITEWRRFEGRVPVRGDLIVREVDGDAFTFRVTEVEWSPIGRPFVVATENAV